MSKKEKAIIFALLGLIIYFPIFLHLDHGALYRWDEATNALHAYEMLQNGNYLRRFLLGTPETWETKPVLLIWLQVISMKIFGYNELAVRMPSAIAVLFTCGIILRFFIKDLKNFWGGIFSVLILLTSSGYLREHVSRTGDHDALLIFFLVTGLIYFYKFLYGEPAKRKRYYWIFVFTLVGGVLTKSITGLYYAPGLLLFTIISKNFVSTIRKKYFWLGVLTFFAIIGAYYLSVEYFYPGYLDLVWNNELFPRFFNTSNTLIFNQMPEPYHFTKILWRADFKWYFWLIFLSLFLIWQGKDFQAKSFIGCIATCALVFHIIVSKGTYNSWYNAPIFPLLAIISATGLSIIFNSVKNNLQLKSWKSHSFTALFCLTFFFAPYQEILLEKCYFIDKSTSDEIYGDYFKRLREGSPDLKNFFVYYEILNRHFHFYEKVYNEQYAYQIRSCGAGVDILNCPEQRRPKNGDHIIICNPDIQEVFLENFEAVTAGTYKTCRLFKLKGPKNSSDQ